MKSSFTIDTSAFQKAARRMGALADQLPFAMAQALNKSADVAARDALPSVWAESVTARNPNFMRAALSTKGTRATKKLLRVIVYDRFGRANLKLHDVGGTARGRGDMAIPLPVIAKRRGAKGIPKGMQPKNLPNSFSRPGKSGSKLIFQRVGKRTKGRSTPQTLRLAYVLKPSNPVRADVPFTATFEATMRREMPKQFKAALARAMATARRVK